MNKAGTQEPYDFTALNKAMNTLKTCFWKTKARNLIMDGNSRRQQTEMYKTIMRQKNRLNASDSEAVDPTFNKTFERMKNFAQRRMGRNYQEKTYKSAKVKVEVLYDSKEALKPAVPVTVIKNPNLELKKRESLIDVIY